MGSGRGKTRRVSSGTSQAFTPEQRALLEEYVDLLLVTGEAAGLRGYVPTREELLEEKEYEFSHTVPIDEMVSRLEAVNKIFQDRIADAKARGAWNPDPDFVPQIELH